jgi:hypothetical protein
MIYLSENMKRRDYLENIDVEDRIIVRGNIFKFYN